MSEPTIMDFYYDLLNTAGLQVDDDFFVVHKADSDKKKPENVTVMNKKLVLPFPGHLKNPDHDNNVFFHPLCEQITRGESEVLAFLKRATTMRLILSMTSLGAGLIRLHTDVNLQKSMSIQQIEFIKDLIDAEDKTIGIWTSFIWGHIKENPHDSTKWPLRLYIKQKGRYQDKSYQRVCSVAFPLFERLFSGEEMPKPGSDQKYRTKDYKAFKQIAKSIFPEVDSEFSEAYNAGYADNFAPNLIAFLSSVKKISERINFVAESLRQPLDQVGVDVDAIIIPLNWSTFLEPEGIEKLTGFSRRIPGLPGNMGVIPSQTEEPLDEVPAPVSTTRTTSRQAPQDDPKERLRAKWQAEKEPEETPPWEETPGATKVTGQRAIGDILKRRPELERSTRTYEEENYDNRGRSYRGRYDDDRGRRSLYGDDDRRGRYDEPVRRGGWRDERDDRDYGRRDERSSRYESPRRGLYDDTPMRGGWRR